jgi:hypothetical protein
MCLSGPEALWSRLNQRRKTARKLYFGSKPFRLTAKQVCFKAKQSGFDLDQRHFRAFKAVFSGVLPGGDYLYI